FAAPRPGPRSAAGPALHQLLIGAEGALGVVIGAVLRVHRLPETTVGRGYVFGNLASGLECMRAIMQAGIRPLVLRLYDADDSAFRGEDDARDESEDGISTAGVAGAGDTEVDASAAYGRAWEGAMSTALELGATISHHHGVGQARARWVADEMGGWMRVWRAVKEGIDPDRLMNPRAVGGAP